MAVLPACHLPDLSCKKLAYQLVIQVIDSQLSQHKQNLFVLTLYQYCFYGAYVMQQRCPVPMDAIAFLHFLES